jgi:hypothetical protein
VAPWTLGPSAAIGSLARADDDVSVSGLVML